jgi:hypothetical protein
LREARRLVDERTVGAKGLGVQALHELVVAQEVACLGLVREQTRFQRRRHQGLEVPPPDLGVGVLAGDHLALLGETQLTADAAGGLGENGLVTGATAAADRAAASMEESEADVVMREDAHELGLGFVELPVRGEVGSDLRQCSKAGQRR